MTRAAGAGGEAAGVGHHTAVNIAGRGASAGSTRWPRSVVADALAAPVREE
ncbi:MAG TPA: hypothetical protein VKV57_03605 [bacterium]|nr:hypothetical protein [bacterium]